jgi:uncharacterized RDD family membrane protein YckC
MTASTFMDWYYAESGRQVGPIKEDALESLVRSGVIKPDTLVWREGMGNWQPYQTVQPMASAVTAGAGAVDSAPIGQASRFCSECGRPFPPTELIAFGTALVCANCKPVFAQKLREGVLIAGAVRYGGFWIRGLALLIDGLILFVVNILVNMLAGTVFGLGVGPIAGASRTPAVFPGALAAFGGVMFLVDIGIGIGYSTWFLVRYGATPGKMALGLKVITATGGGISAPLAIGRFFAHYVDAFTMGIGYIIAAFDDQKRTLHDRICGTRVVRT